MSDIVRDLVIRLPVPFKIANDSAFAFTCACIVRHIQL